MYMEYSFRGLLNALFKHQIKMVAIGAIIVFLGLIYILGIETKFASNASLLVKFGADAVVDIGRDGEDTARNDRKEILQSYVRMISSRDLLIPAVNKLGAEKLYPPSNGDDTTVDNAVDPARIAAARLAGGDVAVSVDAKSNVMEITVFNKDPQVAADFATILVDAFMAHQSQLYSSNDTNFLQEQISEAKQELNKAQSEFLAFKQAAGVSDLQRETELLLEQKSNLSSVAFSALSKAQEELTELKAREAEMLVTYQPSSPLLKSLQDRIEVVEKMVADRQDDLAESETESGTLSPKLIKIDERLAYLEKYRPEYEEHEQEVASKERDYDYYKQKGEDARVSEILKQQNISRISVLEKPVVATSPVSARKKLLLLAFIFLGAFCALGVAIVYELLDDRVSSSEAIKNGTKLPVLASFDKKREGWVA